MKLKKLLPIALIGMFCANTALAADSYVISCNGGNDATIYGNDEFVLGNIHNGFPVSISYADTKAHCTPNADGLCVLRVSIKTPIPTPEAQISIDVKNNKAVAGYIVQDWATWKVQRYPDNLRFQKITG